MTYELLRARASRQDNVVAAWALRGAGMSHKAIAHHTRAMRELHDGVFLVGPAPPTRRQLWWAATLTAPGRHLSNASAASAWGFRPWAGAFEIVTGRGSGGPVRVGAILLCRSTTLAGHTTRMPSGLPITTPERTLADLTPHLDVDRLDRCVREALRLRVTTCARIQVAMLRSSSRNRPRALAELARRYARLPIARARSDAEGYALAIFDAAGLELPRVDARVAGLEADLSWPSRRLIVELDGPDFHQFPDEDARKQSVWEAAGWEVRRLPTDDVYDHPERLLALLA